MGSPLSPIHLPPVPGNSPVRRASPLPPGAFSTNPLPRGNPPHPISILLAGDIQPNPGPGPLRPSASHFLFRPDLLHAFLDWAGLPPLRHDAFSDETNAQTSSFTTAWEDAFLLCWSSLGFVWINPPFHTLARTVHKILLDKPHALLLFPKSSEAWFDTIHTHAQRIWPLPTTSCFCFASGHPAPPAPWPVFIALFFSPTPHNSPTSTSEKHSSAHGLPLICCGDVEQNPGPVDFFTFLSGAAQSFMQSANPTDIARARVDLTLRSQDWPQAWWAPFFPDPSNPPDKDNALQFLSAYELFARQRLGRSAHTIAWMPCDLDTELDSLRRRLAELENPPPPPSEDDLCATLSLQNLRAFKSLRPAPEWMQDITVILEKHLTDSEDDTMADSEESLLEIWRVVVHTFFRFRSTFDSPAQSTVTAASQSSHTTSDTQPAAFTAEEALANGASPLQRRTAQGSIPFILHQGVEYYRTKDGTLWPTSQPPPRDCFKCPGQKHWHWKCPRAPKK